MLLTIFYASATLVQSWRLRSISSSIANKVRDQCTISFYKTFTEDDDGLNSVGASSEACDNFRNGRVVDTIWYHNMLRGVTILPKQILALDRWITFANVPANLNPLYCSAGVDIDSHSDKEFVYVLLETNIYPDLNAIENGASIVSAEKFGKPLAWNIDTNLAIVLKSNVTLFTELLRSSFMQNTLFINNYLAIVRIENVTVHGNPLQLLELDATPIRAAQQKQASNLTLDNLTESQCRHHIDKLRILNLVANLKAEPSPDDYDKDITIEIENATASLNGAVAKENGTLHKDVSEWIKIVESESQNAPSQLDEVGEALILETGVTPVTLSPLPNSNSPMRLENGHIPQDSSTHSPEPSASTHECVDHEEPPTDDVFIENDQSYKAFESRSDAISASDDVSERKTVRTAESMTSSDYQSSQYSTLKRKKRNSDGCKPPNVLVYSESNDVRSSVIATIKNILHPDRYTIYELNTEQLKTSFWIDNTTLLIICGPTSPEVGAILMEYFLCGGKMFCLCSDVLNMVLPTYRTAEVREQELVQFSYGRWQKIQLMHHIFCYHPSPVKKHFSLESDDQFEGQAKPTIQWPGSIDLKDLRGDIHRLKVKVLGSEETWNTPSLILATDTNYNGIAVFSQVHLEVDPNVYEDDASKFAALTRSDKARLEIFSDLLSTQLGLKVHDRDTAKTNMFPPAYFLGRHEAKFVLLEKLKSSFIHPNTLKANSLIVKFYGKNETPKASLENTLPILLHSCPEDFSTIVFFDTLRTRDIGRLTVYAPVINSTMTLVSNLRMEHGFAVIGRKQTAGVGRHKNQWLSPEGCAIFSLQLHIPLSSPLGEKIPLLQHLVSVAIVNSITNIEDYKKLDIRLKWPNDIYANGNTKLGGLIVNTEINGDLAICNVGVGFNLNNTIPTTCVNDMIKTYNLKHNTNLPYLEYEKFFANVFNEIERLIDRVQDGDFSYLYDLYYRLWLHSDAEIVIIDADGHKKLATIIGIDDYGYLLVQQPGESPETVHPDGNTFDILRGLISAKQY